MAKSISNIELLLADESFQRWLSHTATSKENKKWLDWLEADIRHQQLYQEALELWQAAQFMPVALPDIDQEWEKLRQRLKLNSPRYAPVFELSSRKEISHWKNKSWIRYSAVAAIILLIFGIWFYSFYIKHFKIQEFQIISTDFGQRIKISLPEGTKIILNANSTLRYPTRLRKSNPNYFELQGEAYFKVTPRQRNSFNYIIVATKDGRIQVKGTRFTVYERGQGTRVAVEEGCVEVVVASSDTSVSGLASILLNSGNLLQFKKGTRSLKPESVNVLIYTSWWSDQLVLDNSPFKDIVRRLEETYGVNIEVKDNSLLNRRLSGSVENTSLQIITEALGKALQVPVQRKGKVIIFGN